MWCALKPLSSNETGWLREEKNDLKCAQMAQNLHRTLVYNQSTAAESGGLCMLWSQCHSRPPGSETCTRGVPQCFREGVGGLCHCEEALNGNSWHQRSQLTTRTITYWTKKPMEKQHRIYVIGFWVTGPIHLYSFTPIIWINLGLLYNYIIIIIITLGVHFFFLY